MHRPRFIDPLIRGRTSAAVGKAAVSVRAVSISAGCAPGSGAAESHGNSVLSVGRNRLRHLLARLEVRGVRVPAPCQHVLLVLSVVAVLLGVKWHLTVVLFCVSWVANDVDQLFACSQASCPSSLEKRLFRLFAHFFIGLSFRS